jgi:hypothetical protein
VPRRRALFLPCHAAADPLAPDVASGSWRLGKRHAGDARPPLPLKTARFYCQSAGARVRVQAISARLAGPLAGHWLAATAATASALAVAALLVTMSPANLHAANVGLTIDGAPVLGVVR